MKGGASRAALVVIVVLGLAAPVAGIASAAPASQFSSRAALESDVFVQLNQIRTEHGLAPLRRSSALDSAAAQHTSEMLRLGYFDHDSADGTSFDRRIERFYPFGAPYHRWSVGENLVWGAPSLDAAQAVRLWMGSPPHRRNILDPTWREIGISAIHAASASGVYGGQPTTAITTDFGLRL
jgi:uncharacterized protein YkwD